MQYPLNITTLDPTTGSQRPFIVFMAYKIVFNPMGVKSFDDAIEELVPIGNFILPMPNNGLLDSVTNNYDTANGIGGNIAKKGIDLLNKGAEQSTMGVVDNAVQRMGIAPDPKLTQLYQGTNSRTWNGDWQFVPQSKAEAESIMDIIFAIKKWGAPGKHDIKNKIGVLTQPYIFKLKFSNPIIDNVMRYHKMALVSYNTNLFEQGYSSTYNDDMPKHISLRMQFNEYGIKTREDWEQDI